MSSPDPHNTLAAKTRRVAALVLKETRQILRDPSSLIIGIVLPVMLVLLFGYGLSLDVTNVPVAIVLDDHSPAATELASSFRLSRYFQATFATSMAEAERLMLDRQVDGIVNIQSNFARRLRQGDAPVQVLVHGTDANRARIILAYAQAAVAGFAATQSMQGYQFHFGPVTIADRLWFNEANDSRYFLVPGLIVLVMTLIGAFLTALVVAREWERGTVESLFVTPVRAEEFLLSKLIPYFIMGMIGLITCLFAAKFLFHVPLRGSILLLLVTSMCYLLVTLSIGLLISTLVKSQFVASQLASLFAYLPATLLSGFIFDIRNMPPAVQLLTYALPARYYVTLLQTLFLAGNVWTVVIPSTAILAGMALALLIAARLATQKKLT